MSRSSLPARFTDLQQVRRACCKHLKSLNVVVLVGKLREITYVRVEITRHKDVSKVERSSGGLVKEVFKALCDVTVAPFICFRIKIDSAQRYITRNIGPALHTSAK